MLTNIFLGALLVALFIAVYRERISRDGIKEANKEMLFVLLVVLVIFSTAFFQN